MGSNWGVAASELIAEEMDKKNEHEGDWGFYTSKQVPKIEDRSRNSSEHRGYNIRKARRRAVWRLKSTNQKRYQNVVQR